MKVTQIIHQLNNTELGKTGMADSYVNIAKEINLSFRLSNKEHFSMICKNNQKQYNTFRYEIGSEQRIYGFGDVYRDLSPNAGDLVIIEFCEKLVSLKVIHFQNTIILYRMSKDSELEVLNPDRLHLLSKKFSIYLDGCLHEGCINLLGKWKKRQDSKEEVEFYELIIDGVKRNDLIAGKSYKKLSVFEGFVCISDCNKDKLITVEY